MSSGKVFLHTLYLATNWRRKSFIHQSGTTSNLTTKVHNWTVWRKNQGFSKNIKTLEIQHQLAHVLSTVVLAG